MQDSKTSTNLYVSVDLVVFDIKPKRENWQ